MESPVCHYLKVGIQTSKVSSLAVSNHHLICKNPHRRHPPNRGRSIHPPTRTHHSEPIPNLGTAPSAAAGQMLGLTITLALFPPMTIKSPNSPVSADLSNVDIITTARITTMAEHEPEPSSPPAAVADHEKHNEGNTVSSPPQDDCSPPPPPPLSSVTGAGRRRQQLLAALKATDRTVDRFDR